MTKDSRRKRHLRTVQFHTGRRYTPLARDLAATWKPPMPAFTLGALLAECATTPPAPVNSYANGWHWEEQEYLPDAFASQLLGTAVPYGSVLALAGLLAEDGREALLTVESLTPVSQALLVCGHQRLQLLLSQDGCTCRCQFPHCQADQLDQAIPWCSKHLADCPPEDLTWMIRAWSEQHREWVDYDPDRTGGAAQAGDLVKAAAATGTSEKAITELLDHCFDDPDIMEHLDDAELLRLRHAIDRERLRLEQVAKTEVRRIRQTTKTCPACQRELHGWGFLASYRPNYCSPGCAATAPPPLSRTPAPPAPDPWQDQTQ